MTAVISPAPQWHHRLAAAGDAPAEQMTVAYDRLRAALARACRPQRDRQARAESTRLAADVARLVTDVLIEASEQLEAHRKGDSL